MSFIGRSIPQLESWFKSFSIEVFASVLKPEWIKQILESCGRQGKRDRKLPGRFTMWLVIAMGLYRSLSIQNVIDRLGNLPGIGSIWKDGKAPKSASDTEARRRLGVAPLRLLMEKLREWILQTFREAMSWKGLLLLVMDGSTFKIPDSDENRRRFPLPKSSRGRWAFPQMRGLFLASARLRFLLTGLLAPLGRGEQTLALRMLPHIPKGSLVILDRNFNSWQFLVGLCRQDSHFLLRAKRNMRGTPIATLGAGDRLLKMWVLDRARRRDPSLPKTVIVREISVRIQGMPFRFFTSLLDSSAYRAVDIALLYAERWQEEIALDEIKTHQCPYSTVNRPVILRCKSSRLLLQEAYGLMIAYNLVRVLIAQAASKAVVPPLRISFVDSLERIRAAALLMAAAPTRLLPAIFEDLLASIAQRVLPNRRRTNPRAVCVKMSAFPLKRKAS